MDNITDDLILQGLENELSKLLAEGKEDELRRINRESRISKLKLAIDAFKKVDVKEIDENTSEESNNKINYPSKGTWHERIIAYMKFYNKAITVSELVDGIKSYEPDYTKDKLHGAISNMMTGLVKKGDAIKYKPKDKKMKGVYYASPLWFDDKNELMDDHKPDTKKLSLWEK